MKVQVVKPRSGRPKRVGAGFGTRLSIQQQNYFLRASKVPHVTLLKNVGLNSSAVLELLALDSPWLYLHRKPPARKDNKRFGALKPRRLAGKIAQWNQRENRKRFLADRRLFPNGIEYRSDLVDVLLRFVLKLLHQSWQYHFEHQTGHIPAWIDEIRTEKKRIEVAADLINWRLDFEINQKLRQIKSDKEVFEKIRVSCTQSDDQVIIWMRYLYQNLSAAKQRKKPRFTYKSLKVRMGRSPR